ncbi:MAG: hydrogenase formation protein HypD [Candidatus Saccharicenans sp.]
MKMPSQKSSGSPFQAWRSGKIIQRLLQNIKNETTHLKSPLRIMEVCGTHTMTLHRFGLKPLLREAGIEMISGPGCPVCITPDYYHELMIDLVTGHKDIILCTFGDMTRVPTKKGALQTVVPHQASRINIVYSPEEALALAQKNPDKQVIFFGAGFETTIPSIAYTVKKARAEGIKNYSIFSALWLIPPALEAIISSGEIRLDGFIYPGHVSVIIGTRPYRFVAEKYGLPGAIAGFEPADILLALLSVVRQVKYGKPEVANEYQRAVTEEGNLQAQSLMEEMLEEYDADWRGLGIIRRSGLKLREEFAEFDALKRFNLRLQPSRRVKITHRPACRCGEVLKGLVRSEECPLFGKACTPDSPQGPCMVSYEGACLIEFKYSSRGF